MMGTLYDNWYKSRGFISILSKVIGKRNTYDLK